MIETMLIVDVTENGLLENGLLEKGTHLEGACEVIDSIGTEIVDIAKLFGAPDPVEDHNYDEGIVRVYAEFPSKVAAQAANDRSQEFVESAPELYAMLKRLEARMKATKIHLGHPPYDKR